MRKFYVYIMTNKENKVLYVGTTRDLENRVSEHKLKIIEGFTSKYNINKLIYYEEFELAVDAFAREKQLKKWRRSKKVWLVNTLNLEWIDLSRDWY